MCGIDPKNLSKSIVPFIILFPNLIDSDGAELLAEEWRTLLNQNLVDKNLDFENFCPIFFR